MTARRVAVAGQLALIVLVAVNLRPAITSVGPVLTEMRDEFGLSGTAAGALTTVPLLFFGSYGLLAAFLRRAPRGEALLVGGMAVLVAGLLLRLLDAPFFLFAGSLVAGVAISIGNIAVPAIIKRDHPGSITTVTAVYSVAVTVGAAVAAGAAVPVEDALGGSWRLPLSLLVIPATLAGLAWLPRAVRGARSERAARAAEPAGTAENSRHVAAVVWRSGLAWNVTAFMGLQSLLAYVVIGWLPTICQDRGLSETASGYVLGLSSLLQAGGALAVPLLARRTRDQRPLVLATIGLSMVGFAGIAWAPIGSVWAWTVVLGLGQGVGFATALSFLGLRAQDARVAAQLSGMAQGTGYVIAGLGPLAIGALHDATGGWSVPIAVVLVIALTLAIPGLAAGRNRTLAAPVPNPTVPDPTVDDSSRIERSREGTVHK